MFRDLIPENTLLFSSFIQFTKLNNSAISPKYFYESDAGCDLHSVEEVLIPPGEYLKVKTGLAIQLPQNVEGQIRSRSGLAANKGVTVLNSPGTIDPGYTGEIKVTLINQSKDPFRVKQGDRIAQLVFTFFLKAHFQEVESLGPSERGSNGFGSTGYGSTE